MTILKNYNQFGGYYWQSSTIHNALAYAGYKAPHTNQAYSDALLFGISGGANFGYFFFHYEGYDPQINILTRNTFNIFDPILERLGVVQHVIHTQNEDKARQNLLDVLENGEAPIVWADVFTMPYSGEDYSEDSWGMMPLIVYGYEGDTAYIADRSDVGLTAPTAALDAARARVKKDKFRIVTLEAPNPDKLSAAVTAGLWDCIKLYTENPPKGSKDNFGLAAYNAWAQALTKSTGKKSWSKLLTTDMDFYAGLTTAYSFSQLFGKDTSHTAERALFADFLEEAAIILNKPALSDSASQFRKAGDAWCEVGQALLPDDVAPFKQARELMDKRHALFLSQGNAALDEIYSIKAQQKQLKQAISDNFPLDAQGQEHLKANLAEKVMAVHAIEKAAIMALRDVLS
jgi:hypothetical protein